VSLGAIRLDLYIVIIRRQTMALLCRPYYPRGRASMRHLLRFRDGLSPHRSEDCDQGERWCTV